MALLLARRFFYSNRYGTRTWYLPIVGFSQSYQSDACLSSGSSCLTELRRVALGRPRLSLTCLWVTRTGIGISQFSTRSSPHAPGCSPSRQPLSIALKSQTYGKPSRTQNGACSVGSAPFINSSAPADISFPHRQPVELGALPSQFTFSFPPCQARITRRLEQLSGLQVFGKMSLGLLLPH